MKYLILTQPSIEYAKALSESIWAIRKPVSHKGQDDQTSMYCDYMVHPISNEVAMIFPDEIIKVHTDGDFTEFSNLLKTEVDSQESKDVIQQHFDGLKDYLNDNSLPSTISNILPLIFSVELKEKQYMVDNGWFAVVE